MKNFNLNKLTLSIKQNSPALLVYSGVTGIVATIILACIATRKLDKVAETAKETIDIARNQEDQEESKKELTIAYLKAGAEITKLYLPSIGIGVLSVSAILSSHHIMSRRNMSLTAAYTILDTLFKGYQSRVKTKYGEDEEWRIRYDIQDEKIEETVTDEKGVSKKVKKTIQVANVNENMDYSRYFRKQPQNDLSLGSSAWDDDPYLREFFIRRSEFYANDLFRAKGCLFLNDVYEILGFQKTVAGQTVGWVNDDDNAIGDNCVIFTTKEVYLKDSEGEVEPAILIDFNVHGNILSRAVQSNLLKER